MSAECDNEGCRNVRANFDKLRRETILMSRINTQKEADANVRLTTVIHYILFLDFRN